MLPISWEFPCEFVVYRVCLNKSNSTKQPFCIASFKLAYQPSQGFILSINIMEWFRDKRPMG